MTTIQQCQNRLQSATLHFSVEQTKYDKMQWWWIHFSYVQQQPIYFFRQKLRMHNSSTIQLLVNILCFVFCFITLIRLSRSTILCTIIIHLISIIMPIISLSSLPDVRHSETVTNHWSWVETWPIIQKTFLSMSD